MQALLGDILAKRRDRAIAIVLGVKERECDKHLPLEARQRLRKAVLDQFNDLTDIAMDLMRSIDTDVVMNETYLERMDKLHDDVTEIRKAVCA